MTATRDKARETIKQALIDDMADSLRDDPNFRRQLVCEGWEGFAHKLDSALIECAIDAGLNERNEVADAIEHLMPGRLG